MRAIYFFPLILQIMHAHELITFTSNNALSFSGSTLSTGEFVLVYVPYQDSLIIIDIFHSDLGKATKKLKISLPGLRIMDLWVVPHSDGGFTVAWCQEKQNDYYQREEFALRKFDHLHEQTSASSRPFPTSGKEVTLLPNGKYLFTWFDQSQCLINRVIFTSEGFLDSKSVISVGFSHPSTVTLADGSSVIVWDQFGSVFLQKIDEYGKTKFSMRKEIGGFQFARNPRLLLADTESFITVWTDFEMSTGICMGNFSTNNGAQLQPIICPIQQSIRILDFAISVMDDLFLVVWVDTSLDVYVQRVSFSGELLGSTILISTKVEINPSSLIIAGNSINPQFRLFWISNYKVEGALVKLN